MGTGLGWWQPVFVPAASQKELSGLVFYLRANVFLGELLKIVEGREVLFTQESFQSALYPKPALCPEQRGRAVELAIGRGLEFGYVAQLPGLLVAAQPGRQQGF